MDTYLPHVGYVRFPRRPSDLGRDACPACFTTRAGETCGGCGLDLASPIIAELDAVSVDAAASLDRRLELIGRIRFDSAALAAALSATLSPQVVPEQAQPIQPPAARPPSAVTGPQESAPARSHIGVQVLLLVVGVSLLAVGAIFFLVYAFINFGLVWRSVIIAAITITAILSASLLQRRKLAATAESISALGVVLVYLDAFALRENNLLGLGATDGLTYWGVAVMLASIGLIGWHRITGLRLPSIVGFATFAPGASLVVAGVTAEIRDADRIFASLVTLAIAALVYPAARRRTAEKLIMLSLAIAGLAGGAIASLFVSPQDAWAPALALSMVTTVCLAHALVAVHFDAPRTLAAVIAAIGGLTASVTVAVLVLSMRVDEDAFLFSAQAICAAIVALTLELVFHRTVSPVPRRLALVAAVSAGALAVLQILVPILDSLTLTLSVMSGAIEPWSVTGTSRFSIQPHDGWAVLALLVILALCAAAWAASSLVVARRVLLIGAIYAIAISATPLLGVPWAVVAGWLVLAAAGVFMLVSRRRWPRQVRRVLAAGALVSTVAGYFASWVSIDTWWYGSLGAIALLVSARWVVASHGARSVLLSIGAILALVAAGAEGWHLSQRFATGDPLGLDANHAVLSVGILLIVFSVASAGRLVSPIEVRSLFWVALTASGTCAAISWNTTASSLAGSLGSAVFDELTTSLVLGSMLVISLLLWVVPRVLRSPLTPTFRVERIAASVAIAPSLAWLVNSFTRALELPALVGFVAPISAALIVSAGTLTVAVLRPDGVPRWARELGVALVVVPALMAAVVAPTDVTWLALVLGGVVVLLVAVSTDGVFGSASPRRHLGWAALALGCWGLWWKLGGDRVQNLEPYVLPLAGMLLAIALLNWWAARANRASPHLALAGLLVAIVPLAADSTSGSAVRALVIAAASTVLVVGGSFVPCFVHATRGALRPYVDVAAFAGAVGVVTAGLGHAVAGVVQGRTNDLLLDLWLGGSVLVLLVAAVGQAMSGDQLARGARAVTAQGIAVVAAACVVVTTVTVLGAAFAPIQPARGVSLLLLICVIQIVGLVFDRSRFTRLLEVSRPIREVGLALVALPVLVFAVARPTDATWLSIIVGGLFALLVAVSPDGVFGSTSRRRYIGWIALAFGVTGLWWRLGDEAVRDVAPYVLPLAGALLVIALLTWLAGRNARSAPSSAAPLIALVGLIVGVIPLAAESTAGSTARAVIVAGCSALLLLAGSFSAGGSRLRPYLDAAAIAGALGLVIAGIGRSLTMATRGEGVNTALDAWLIGTLLVLVLASAGQRSLPGTARRVSTQLFLGIALVLIVGIELSVLTVDPLGYVRAITLLIALSAIHVVGLLVDHGPFSRQLGWAALILAALAGAFVTRTSVLEPLELSALVIASALLVVGAARLARLAESGSWAWLAPGILVLLGPSLIATFTDAPAWRLVALGSACVVVIVVGALRGLQAPLLIGSAIVLIHAIRTFLPQLVSAYQATEWWVWAVVGGAIIFFIGFTFEKRRRDFTTVTTRVARLR